MKTTWDYTDLAESFSKRPGYCQGAIRRLLGSTGLHPGGRACDIGAGTGHLTIPLLEAGFRVVAVEPNSAMLRIGRARTRSYTQLAWVQALGESTGLAPRSFELVTFGSSFNVVNRSLALEETSRILKAGGWCACLWNHRELTDPLQHEIEELIRSLIPGYRYGTRRQDQTAVILGSGLFEDVRPIDGNFVHRMTVADCLEAWRSHATLCRQCGSRFPKVLAGIEGLLRQDGRSVISVPYVTRAWIARKK